jgi:hypothetical protein
VSGCFSCHGDWLLTVIDRAHDNDFVSELLGVSYTACEREVGAQNP